MVKIRKAEESDFEGVYRITGQVQNFHLKHRTDIYKKDGVALTLKMFESFCRNQEKYHVYVAESADGNIIGYAVVAVQIIKNNELLNDAKIFFIDAIAADKNYRRMGVGKNLFDAIKKDAQDEKASRITLNVWSFNKDAVAFYESLGMNVQSIKYECLMK